MEAVIGIPKAPSVGDASAKKETAKSRLQNILGGKIEEGSSLLDPKTSRLNKEGKSVARSLYQEVSSESVPDEITKAAKDFRKDISQSLSQIKKEIRAGYLQELLSSGKKRKEIDRVSFDSEVKKRIEENETVKGIQLRRKFLSSLSQHARSELTRKAREEIKLQITGADVSQIRLEFQQKGLKIPSEALLKNVIVQKRLKEQRQQQVQAPSESAAVQAQPAPSVSEELLSLPPQPQVIPFIPRAEPIPTLQYPPEETVSPPAKPLPEAQAASASTEQHAARVHVTVRRRIEEIVGKLFNNKKSFENGKRDPRLADALFVKVSRRKALADTAAAGLGIAVSWKLKQKGLKAVGDVKPPQFVQESTTKSPVQKEAFEKPIEHATGTFLGTKEAYVPGTFEKVSLQDINSVTILGYPEGEQFLDRFLIEDPKNKGKVLEIPISSLEVKGHVISKEKMPRLEGFGIRNNYSDIMNRVPEIGASMVRIAGGHGELFTTDSQVRKAIEAAKAQKLDIVYDLNPGKYISPEDTRRRIQQFFDAVGAYDKKIILELGNEPDGQEVEYWEKRDIKTFARWVAEATVEAKKQRLDVEVVVGALVNANLQGDLVSHAISYGLDPRSVTWAIHAYGMDEVMTKIPKVRRIVGNNIMLTEVGIQEVDKKAFPQVLDKARAMGASRMLVHELPESEEGYGQMDPFTGDLYAGFFYLQNYVLKRHKRS